MSGWKKVRIAFPTIKLGNYIEPIKTTVADIGAFDLQAYGVTNKDGITITGKEASKDKSKYIILEKNCFAFNPYRINVGSIGLNEKGIKGCVSPAYIVFKTKKPLLAKFLYFYLKSDYGNHLINWYGNRGGVRNALRYSDLCKIDIPDIRNLNQEKLLEQFNTISLRTDCILEEIEKQKVYIRQLRQSVLQEAIEGKLTANWRKDHPVVKGNPDYDAEALFQKIQEEKEKQIKDREKKADRGKLSVVSDEEKTFIIPNGWKWVRLGEISLHSEAGKSFACQPENIQSTEWGIIKTSAITSGFFIESENKFFSKNKPNKINENWIIRKGDLLFCRASGSKGLAGKSCIVNSINSNLLLSDKSIRLILPEYFNHELVNILNNSEYGENYRLSLATNKSTSMNNLTREQILAFVFPLPPIAEQAEIVRCIETHLAKIARMEQQITERETLTKQLMSGILKDAFEER